MALRNSIEEYFGGHSKEDTNKIHFADVDLEREIGAGSAKTVFEARWRGKQVAALKMKAGACETEAGVLTRLSKHPSLIRFYGVVSHAFLACSGSASWFVQVLPRSRTRNSVCGMFYPRATATHTPHTPPVLWHALPTCFSTHSPHSALVTMPDALVYIRFVRVY